MNTTDERKGLPSASGAQRYSLCPGSFLAEKGLPDIETEDSERGDRIHAVLAGEAPMESLNEEDQELARKCLAQSDTLVAGVGAPCVSYTERRLWGFGCSGKADLIAITENRMAALVVDYKTGRGEVEESPRNMQLRVLATLVWSHYGVEHVDVAIVQPLVSRTPLVTRYDVFDLKNAFKELSDLMFSVTQPGQPRRPSPEACKYCKANSTDRCPESRGVVTELVVAGQGASLMSPTTLGAFLEACVTAEKTIEKAREHAKAMLSEGVEIPGWALKEGREIEKVTQPGQVFSNWLAQGGDADRFQKAVSLTKKAISEVAKEQWPGLSSKELKQRVDAMLDGATEIKRSAPILTRVA